MWMMCAEKDLDATCSYDSLVSPDDQPKSYDAILPPDDQPKWHNYDRKIVMGMLHTKKMNPQ